MPDRVTIVAAIRDSLEYDLGPERRAIHEGRTGLGVWRQLFHGLACAAVDDEIWSALLEVRRDVQQLQQPLVCMCSNAAEGGEQTVPPARVSTGAALGDVDHAPRGWRGGATDVFAPALSGQSATSAPAPAAAEAFELHLQRGWR